MSREAELEAQSRSELRMAERSEEEAAGCVLCEGHTKICLGKEKWDHLALG